MEGMRSLRIFQVTSTDTQETGGRSEDGEGKTALSSRKPISLTDRASDEMFQFLLHENTILSPSFLYRQNSWNSNIANRIFLKAFAGGLRRGLGFDPK